MWFFAALFLTFKVVFCMRSGTRNATRFLQFPCEVMALKACLQDNRWAEEIVDVNYQGEEMEVGFNVTYILDVLNALKCQQVRIRLTDASSSCLIENSEDASAEYVIMPMRL